MKGQLVFEFVIAALILFTIVIYTINFLSSTVGNYHSRFLSSFLESKALLISEIVMNDPSGGIVSEWPLLSPERMTDLNDTCRNEEGYYQILQKLGLVEEKPYEIYHHMNILVREGGIEYVNCGRLPPGNMSKAVVTRYGLLASNEIAPVQITVW